MATFKCVDDRQGRQPAHNLQGPLQVPVGTASTRGTVWSCTKSKSMRSCPETRQKKTGGVDWTYNIEGCITVVDQDRELGRIKSEVRVARGHPGARLRYALTRRIPINGQTVVVTLVAEVCCLDTPPGPVPRLVQCQSPEGEALSHD